MAEVDKNTHRWNFITAGGAIQADIACGEDITKLCELDPKLWVALSSPSKNLRFDGKTLQYLDADNDGRVRTPEITGAISWLSKRFKNFDGFFTASPETPIDEFRNDSDEGKALLDSIKRILSDINKSEASSITLDEAENAEALFNASAFNGDGIVTANSTDSETLKTLIGEIISCCGSETDRSGEAGVNTALIENFFTAVSARLQWLESQNESMLPLGENTAAAAAAIDAVSAKINDFFNRCALIAYDGKLSQTLNSDEAEIAAIAPSAITGKESRLEALPLAMVAENAPLPLSGKVNPYWAEALDNFATLAVRPILGDIGEITFDQWKQLCGAFAEYRAWQSAEAGKEVAALDRSRLEELQNSSAAAELAALIEQDCAVADEHSAFTDVSKALRLRKNFVTFLRNYVNMAELYNPESSPIYRVGSLYIDARTVRLCFEVANLAEFQKLAATSKCCLVYCTLKREGAAPRTICGVVTAGVAQNLWIGRNGVFYDLDGSDWEATVVKVDSHDISLREAFWSPWRKIGAMISQQVNKLLTSKQDAALGNVSTKIEKGAKNASAGTVEPPKKMDGAALASSVAALGIAVGMVGAAVGGLVSAIAGIPLWKTGLGICGIILAVSTPSVIITWFSLRARNLAPILNAGGWAVNRPLKFSFKLAGIWTALASLPEKSSVSRSDPFADRKIAKTLAVWFFIAAIFAAGVFWLWNRGCADSILPECCRKNHPAPAAEAAATTNAPSSQIEKGK